MTKFFLLSISGFVATIVFAQKHDSALVKLNPQIIQINLTTNNYQEILKGFPQTASLKSGLVTLMPNQNVGEHSTENNEEMIVVLEGECDLIIKKTIIACCLIFK